MKVLNEILNVQLKKLITKFAYFGNFVNELPQLKKLPLLFLFLKKSEEFLMKFTANLKSLSRLFERFRMNAR